MDVNTFRQRYPEFTDPESYLDAQISFWMTVAASSVNTVRWGDLAEHGIGLFTAHHLALAKRDQDTDDAGGVPGEVKGPTTSKSVDKVSVGYDSRAVSMDGGGMWNATRYGIEYLRYAKIFGAGGLQL